MAEREYLETFLSRIYHLFFCQHRWQRWSWNLTGFTWDHCSSNKSAPIDISESHVLTTARVILWGYFSHHLINTCLVRLCPPMASSNIALKTFSLANDIQEISPQDQIYAFDVEADKQINRESPWAKELSDLHTLHETWLNVFHYTAHITSNRARSLLLHWSRWCVWATIIFLW